VARDPPERDRESRNCRYTQRLRQYPRRAGYGRDHLEVREHPWREHVVGVAGREHQARDAFGIRRRRHLCDRAAGVVTDERGLLDAERVQDVDHDLRLTRRAEIGIAAHRAPMGALRERRCDAAHVRLEAGDDLPPVPEIRREGVDEDDRLARAGLLDVDDAGRDPDLSHG
jgi:hypothetical protein